jgi:hypothetical protein
VDGIIRIDQVVTSAQKAQIAHLLYEKDSAFVPVTPLATLNESTTFLMATLDGSPDRPLNEGATIRAASSYERWLVGCDRTMSVDCDVYELASSPAFIGSCAAPWAASMPRRNRCSTSSPSRG